MSTIRKKRNFKGLGLDVSTPTPAPEPEPLPMPTRLAPAAGGAKKRPPPMTLKVPKVPPAGLTAENTPVNPPSGVSNAASPEVNNKRMTYHTALSHTLANLDLNAERKFDLKNNEDLKELRELGSGNGGSVKQVEHVPSGTLMAKKVCMAVDPWLRCVTNTGCGRLSLSTQNQQSGSRYCVNFRSCMTAIPHTSSRFMARSLRTRTYAFAWSLWIRARLMVSTRRLGLLIWRWLARWHLRSWRG